MYIMHLIDQIDPYPLVLKRWTPPVPAEPNYADEWFQGEYDLLRKKAEVTDKIVEKAGKAIPTAGWARTTPRVSGEYTAKFTNIPHPRELRRIFVVGEGWMNINGVQFLGAHLQDKLEWLVGSRT